MHDILKDITTELALQGDGRINDPSAPVDVLKRAKAEIEHLRHLVRLGYTAETEAHQALNTLMADFSRLERAVHNYLNDYRDKSHPQLEVNPERSLAYLAMVVGRPAESLQW